MKKQSAPSWFVGSALCVGLLLSPFTAAAQERNWQVYHDLRYQVLEVDASSVRASDKGLVFFQYRARPSKDSNSLLNRPISGVVDCAARQRADVEGNGSYTLRDIYPGTSMAMQLDFVCALAGRSGGAQAQAASAKPAQPSPATYSDEDGTLLWEEAIHTFNGLAYDYTTYTFDARADAENCISSLQAACRRKGFPAVRYKGVRNNELPLWLRGTIVRSPETEYVGPVRNPADGRWTVVFVRKAQPATFIGAVNPREWVMKHAATALPSVEELRSDPELSMRRAMNKVRSAADLRQALASQQIDKAHLDAPLSNGSTLVRRTLALKNMELLEALAAEGASLDKCDDGSLCPMTQVIYEKDHALLRWMLAHGASREGSGKEITPLMAACVVADREAAQILLEAGANLLATHEEKVGNLSLKRSAAFYVPSSEPAYLDWLSGMVQSRLAKTGKYEWSAWIEQGGKRHPIVDNATIALKRQPFKIVMKAPDGDNAFRMAVSEDDALLEKAQTAVFRRQVLSPFKIGASSPDSTYLGVGVLKMEEGEWNFDGATKELSFSTDPELQAGTKRVRAGRSGHEDVYTVTELILSSGTTEIAKFTGPSLSAVLGLVPDLGTGADFYKPARVKIVFR